MGKEAAIAMRRYIMHAKELYYIIKMVGVLADNSMHVHAGIY